MMLSLDLAGSTGYALYLDGKTKVGMWRLTRGNIGPKRSPLPMYRLWKRLHRLHAKLPISRIVFEETFARGTAKHRLDTLQACVLLFCMVHRIRFVRINPAAWKKAMLGKNCSKEEYYRAALTRFKHVDIWSDDMAAALWLLEYGKFFNTPTD